MDLSWNTASGFILFVCTIDKLSCWMRLLLKVEKKQPRWLKCDVIN